MAEQRNVILVTIDSLRADHCGFMGYEGETTPTLDALAADGLVFDRAFASAGSTSGSAPTFLTGSYPIPHADRETHTEYIRHHFEARETVAERFRSMGYETAIFTANPWMSRYFLPEETFDRFEDFMDSDLSRHMLEESRGTDSQFRSVLVRLLNWWQGQDMFMSWESLYPALREWLDDAESPYFVWVFLVDAHMPFIPTKRNRTQSRLLTYPANAWLFSQPSVPFESRIRDVLIEDYDNTIRDADAFLETLLGELDTPDDESEPLVVVHADHGEELGENRSYGHGSLSEEVLHVPLVVANGPKGRVSAPFAQEKLPDLLTTLASGADFEHLPGPVARCRTFGSRAIRGPGFKFTASDGDERLVRTGVGEPVEFDDDRLAELCRRIVAQWRETDEERRRVGAAASELVAEADL